MLFPFLLSNFKICLTIIINNRGCGESPHLVGQSSQFREFGSLHCFLYITFFGLTYTIECLMYGARWSYLFCVDNRRFNVWCLMVIMVVVDSVAKYKVYNLRTSAILKFEKNLGSHPC